MLLAGALFGCDSSATSKGGDLLARGEGFEVTLPELDQVLRAAPRVEKQQIAAARRALLERLVDEKLFADAAVAAKLDQDVETMRAIQAARRVILARAYAQRIINKVGEPTTAEVHAAAQVEPAGGLVRALTVDELTAPANLPALSTLQQNFDSGGLEALASALKAQDLPSERTTTRLGTADLSGVPAGRLAALKTGEQVMFQIADRIHFARVKGIERAAATPASREAEARRGLIEQRRIAALESDLARLKHERKIMLLDPTTRQPLPAKP